MEQLARIYLADEVLAFYRKLLTRPNFKEGEK